MLDSGISMIEVIKNKLLLLCKRAGIQFVPDNNIASMLERFSVAVNAVLITGIQLKSFILFFPNVLLYKMVPCNYFV